MGEEKGKAQQSLADARRDYGTLTAVQIDAMQIGPPRIAGLINALVSARANARAWATAVAESRKAWESEHAKELAALKSAKDRLASADKALRLEALALYDKHGAVPNAPGVGTRVRRVVEYSDDAAIAWAIKTEKLQFLCVNRSLLDKHARAVADTAPLSFASIVLVPGATIAKNLPPWVYAKPETDEGECREEE